MSFRSFADHMLRAVYEEDRSGSGQVDLLDLPQKYGFVGNADWVSDWAEAHAGFLKFASNPPPQPPNPMLARLNGTGRLHIEQQFGDKGGVPTLIAPAAARISPDVANEDQILTEEGTPIVLERVQVSQSDHEDSRSIDSRAWTGTQHLLVDRVVIQNVRTHANALRSMVYELHIPNNAQSADLKALVDMLIQALEMCEPEVTLIKRILASPKFKISAALIGAVAAVRGAGNF